MHKFIFNRLFIAILLLLMQIAIIAWFMNEASEYYVLFNILSILISLFFAVKVFKNRIPANTKIIMIIILIIFPISGIFLYYFSLESKMRKKFVTNLKNQTFTLESLYVENKAIKEQLLAENKEVYRQSQYIANNSFLPAYANIATKYFPDGEPFFRSLLQDLKTAKDFIFIEFFIIGKGALWNSILTILAQKAREGVEVRVIFDDIGSYNTLPDHYHKHLESLGIRTVVFNPISPIISLAHNHRDHKKNVVIDGKIAYTGGVNIADEYVHKKERFGYWKDAGIKVVGDATKSFTLMFLETWHYFKDSSEDCSIYLNVAQEYYEPTPGYVQPYSSDPLSEIPLARNVYLNLIHTASDYIYITTPYLALDQEFMDALIQASQKGIDVRIIIPNIPDKKYIYRVTESYAKEFLKHHITFYKYQPGFIHSKTILVDDHLSVVGTVNFDYRSFYHNYECGVLLYQTESTLAIKKDFEKLFRNCIEIDTPYIEKHWNKYKSFLGGFFKIFSPLF